MRPLLIAALVFAFICPAQAGVRVVSLNPCLDTILVEIADRSQIAAVSHYAADPRTSTISAIAKTLPVVREAAEDVIMLRPDLVLAAYHNSPATRNALNRLGIRMETFRVPESVSDSIAQVRAVAHMIGREEQGEAVIARIAQALAAAAPPPGARRFTALIFQANGMAPGRGTLADEMLARTGFINAADRYSLDKWQNVPLERLIADPPDVLLAGELEANMPTWVDRIQRHPALKDLGTHTVTATFPEQLLYCGGTVLIETARVLAEARTRAAAAHP